jgi:four helix bundle protein
MAQVNPDDARTLKHKNIKTGDFKKKLKKKMDEYVNFVYIVTRQFPREELYSSVSQWRRSTLSIILNYVEGYARRKTLVQLNFLEIAYGSFKESKYLLHFAKEQEYLNEEKYMTGLKLSEEIGAMLWTEVNSLSKSIENPKT